MARVVATVLVFVLALVAPARSHGDPVTTSTLGWTINGIVSEVARAGDVAFVGGSFGTVAPAANLVFGFATFAVDSAVPVLPHLEVNGRVRAVTAVPGGWVIGGDFTSVSGVARQRLARIGPDGSLDLTFAVAVDDTVWALASSGTTLYLGGDFTTVAGATHHGLAAINMSTGAPVTAFAPSVLGGSVCDILVSGANVYLAGDFATVNGANRANIAAVVAADGSTVTAFNANANGRVAQLLMSGTDLFAAGEFSSIGGASRSFVGKLTASTGAAVTAFNANANDYVHALALAGATLYAGGAFSQMGGQSRTRLAAVNSSTGVATSWNPGADADVLDLALTGTNVIAAGDFSEIAGVERLALAMLDTTATTTIATSWNPALGNGADHLFVDAVGNIFVAGGFNNYGAVQRSNLAAIDLLTGDLLPWNPGTNGWVHALDFFGNTVYVGGEFTSVAGTSRDHVAALDAVTGALATWNPGPNNTVKGLMTTSGGVYFVGSFTGLAGGATRGHGAAADHSGAILPWNPAADDDIDSLFVDGSRVFLGGAFTQLGIVTRERLGAVDSTTGAVSLTFAPSVNDVVYRVDVQNNIVFFGGAFDMVDAATRNHAAAVRSSTVPAEDGLLLTWHPDVDGPVYDIDAFGANVFLAGGFGAVGGESRPGIAMVDALPTGGALRAWKPADVSGGAVSVIDTSDTAVLYGGLLNDLNGISIGAVLYPEASLGGTPRPPTTPDIFVRGSLLRIDWARPPLGARPLAYVIEGGSGPGRSDLASFSTGNIATTFSASGLGPGTYYLRMRSTNAQGVGAASREQAFTIGGAGCSGPPAPPLDLVAAVSGANVTLTWRAPAQSIVSSFRLVVGLTSTGSEVGPFDVGAATTFSVAAPAGAYFVRVVAVNACGVSARSGEAVVIVGSPVVPPGAPFGLDASVSGSTVVLAWARPSVGSGSFQYRVEAGSSTGSSNLAAVTTSQTTFTATGVPPGIYYVRVRAIGAGGTGPVGNEVVVVVQ